MINEEIYSSFLYEYDGCYDGNNIEYNVLMILLLKY